ALGRLRRRGAPSAQAPRPAPLGDRNRAAGRRARSAARLAATLGRLRGPFAKMGQFASLRVDVLEPEVREALAGLRRRIPPLPAPWIREVVERELGAPLPERFARFDPVPLGAASIAQAHRAALPDGTEVVVKVQYPWLAASLPADLRWLRALLRAGGGRALLESGAFEEFAAAVAEELDFRREAAVAREIAANLADDPSVVVPRVVESHSARRVLTVEWLPALPIDDREALARRGVAPAAVLEIVARAYARMVFGDGVFHADPHPGNLFVLDEPTAGEAPRVLFVDFGLSKRLDPALRAELRRGILALLKGDLEAFLAGMHRMGMVAPGAEPAVREAVASMFARLRGEGGGPLGLGGERVRALKDEAKRLLAETPGLVLPTELLLYAKTVSYLFGLGAELAPQVDLMRLSVPHLLRFLAERDPAEGARAASAAPRAADPAAG
ncbi:MAG: AarF/UbiB family protein, partial [Myxococcota bacterium]|nr:AarF/UbiB family protein [Myxococcota bacterium]